MKLSDKALLVQLSISQWTARKYDKKATEQVASANNAAVQSGRYNKSLLPMNDFLTNVHQKSTLIRKKYYANTLPWGIDGTQILPSANYLSFMTDFRKEKYEWQMVVNSFLSEYMRLKTHARVSLNTLYNEADYPPQDEVASKFNMDMSIMPVPDGDFRVDVAEEELARITADVERRVVDASQNAMKEAWNRLHDRVKHMAEKLDDPKAVFRDTLVENTREICSVLTRLNFTDDPNLEAMRQEVEQSLTKHHPDALRNDPDLRRDKAAEAKAIMAKMGAFMGANNGD
jgi:hypothetical protein|tara:strand:+ start:8310 stop:9170 length:861 start_codon:yes stop_codon:yes gene_type:complete